MSESATRNVCIVIATKENILSFILPRHSAPCCSSDHDRKSDGRLYQHCILSLLHSSSILLLALVEDGEALLGGLDARQRHGAEGGPHAVGAVDLAELHAAADEPRDDLAGALDDGVLGRVHVEATHAAEALESAHADEALGAESAERPVVARRADDQRRVDSARVHARLVVVVHGHEGPVGDDAGDADAAGGRFVAARDQVLDRGGVEELHVGEGQDLGQEG